MVIEIKNYIKEQKVASIDEMVLHFNTGKSIVEGALMRLLVKGLIEEVESSCSSCRSCSLPGGTCEDKYFKWREDAENEG